MSHNEYQNQMDYEKSIKKYTIIEPLVSEEEEEMKSIDWVKRNEKMIDFTIDRSNETDTEPESDTDTEYEYQYTNYGIEPTPRFGTLSYQVAGGGLMNGNAYATVELKEGKYYYCEYGANPCRDLLGTTIKWCDEGYNFDINE